MKILNFKNLSARVGSRTPPSKCLRRNATQRNDRIEYLLTFARSIALTLVRYNTYCLLILEARPRMKAVGARDGNMANESNRSNAFAFESPAQSHAHRQSIALPYSSSRVHNSQFTRYRKSIFEIAHVPYNIKYRYVCTYTKFLRKKHVCKNP